MSDGARPHPDGRKHSRSRAHRLLTWSRGAALGAGALMSIAVTFMAPSSVSGAPFCIAGGHDRLGNPALSGKEVVWLARRGQRVDIHGQRVDIHGQSLAIGRSFVVTTSGTVATGLGGPAVSGRRVVWVDCRLCIKAAGLPGFRNTGVYLRALPAGHERLLSPPGQDPYAPAVSGSTVVWVGHHQRKTDIYGRNLANSRLFRVSTSGTAGPPAISGTVVVWQDRRSGDWDIYGKDLRTNREFIVARHRGRGNYLEKPAVSGRIVVWTSWRSDQSVAIDGVDLSTHHRFTVSVIPPDHYNPQLGPTVAISGRVVVWDQAKGLATSSSADHDILGRDITIGHTFVVTSAKGDQTSPAISGETVMWAAHGQICGTLRLG
jgi:beta propeller repeat protein